MASKMKKEGRKKEEEEDGKAFLPSFLPSFRPLTVIDRSTRSFGKSRERVNDEARCGIG